MLGAAEYGLMSIVSSVYAERGYRKGSALLKRNMLSFFRPSLVKSRRNLAGQVVPNLGKANHVRVERAQCMMSMFCCDVVCFVSTKQVLLTQTRLCPFRVRFALTLLVMPIQSRLCIFKASLAWAGQTL